MGCNYYLRKKCPMTSPAYVGCDCGHENEPIELTNGFVWHNTYYPTKEECDKVFQQEFHIGKSSAGWYFHLAIYPEYGIHNFDDWKQLFLDPQNEIYDEYGEKISPEEMIACITIRGQVDWDDSSEAVAAWEKQSLDAHNEMCTQYHFGKAYLSYDDYMAENHAERGVRGLWRSKVDEYTSHPDDLSCTYDYVLSGNDPETGCIFC